MEWFWSNLIITLNSSVFIVLYLAMIVFCNKIYRHYEFNLLNQSLDNSLPDEKDDPLFIAWLKDPQHGIFKIVFGSLLEEGYISKGGCSGVYQTTMKVKRDKTAQETFLLDYFSTPNTLSNAHNHFRELKKTFRDKAEHFHLIIQKETRNQILRFSRITSLALMALGVYRVAGTINTGSYDILILIIIIFPTIFILFDENRLNQIMLSPKGEKYLESWKNSLSESSVNTVNQTWLLKILGGSALISALNTQDNFDIYINLSDSIDSSYDSSFNSSCDSSDSTFDGHCHNGD